MTTESAEQRAERIAQPFSKSAEERIRSLGLALRVVAEEEIRAAVEQERRECMAADCTFCADIVPYDTERGVHIYEREQGVTYYPQCAAADIRARGEK